MNDTESRDRSVFYQSLLRSQLVDPRIISRIIASIPTVYDNDPGTALAKTLVKDGHLTPYQVEHLLQGRCYFHIGKYEITDFLGNGWSMAQVVRARDPSTEQYVAIKVLPKGKSYDTARARRHLVDTIPLNRQLGEVCANVVDTYDHGSDSRCDFHVMQLIQGKDLRQHVLKNVRLSPIETVRIGLCIARILESAEFNDMSYRQLGPHDVMLASDSTVMMTSCMSLARLGDTGRVNPIIVDFAAPEIHTDGSEAATDSSCYTLGCLLFYLLTGRVLFLGSGFREKRQQQLSAAPAKASTLAQRVPPELESLIHSLLEKDRNKRPPLREVTARLGQLSVDSSLF